MLRSVEQLHKQLWAGSDQFNEINTFSITLSQDFPNAVKILY
jgi:hypothetical protein